MYTRPDNLKGAQWGHSAAGTEGSVKTGSLSFSQPPGGPPCWSSPLAFGLIGQHLTGAHRRSVCIMVCLIISNKYSSTPWLLNKIKKDLYFKSREWEWLSIPPPHPLFGIYPLWTERNWENAGTIDKLYSWHWHLRIRVNGDVEKTERVCLNF